MRNVPIKTRDEIKVMGEGGKIGARVVEYVFSETHVGVSTLELENKANQFLSQFKEVKPAFKGFNGYKHSLVTCLNEEVVHGIPSERKIKDGDVLTIDF